jgi:2-amino-4-hydroxy-6-hydroxymethyldihydropteridine diphosphokinase
VKAAFEAGARGYLGLGSNIGSRRANLEEALRELPAHGVQVLRSSSVYDTEPVGMVLDQPPFLNACVQIQTDHDDPEQLLDACKEVERVVGRVAGGERHGPRIIDIDLLLLEHREYTSSRLRLPHAEVASRRFVLVPLLELDPELTLPDGTRLADVLAGLEPGQAVRRAGPPLL